MNDRSANEVRLFMNYFQTSVIEKRHVGSRIQRRYGAATAPLDRLIALNLIDETTATRLLQHRNSLDPFVLSATIERRVAEIRALPVGPIKVAPPAPPTDEPYEQRRRLPRCPGKVIYGAMNRPAVRFSNRLTRNAAVSLVSTSVALLGPAKATCPSVSCQRCTFSIGRRERRDNVAGRSTGVTGLLNRTGVPRWARNRRLAIDARRIDRRGVGNERRHRGESREGQAAQEDWV